MKEILLKLLIIAYAGVGVMSVIGYLPKIRDLYHHKKQSANISSYVLWTITGAIAFLYSLFILPDLLFIIVSGLSFASCAVVLFLSIKLRNNS
jgi:uncharacterized membrane protein